MGPFGKPRRAGRRLAFALAGAAMALAPAFQACAGPSIVRLAAADPFSALVGERRERKTKPKTPPVERYLVSSDDRAFLLQGDVGEARIKFLCSDQDPRLECRLDDDGGAAEIHRVTGARGPRGDVIYKNAEGDVLLRITAYGGATVFWPGDPQGRAASPYFSEGETLALTSADRSIAERRASAASAALSARTGEPIVFDLGPTPTVIAFADAVAEPVAAPAPAAALVADEAAPAARSGFWGEPAAAAAEEAQERAGTPVEDAPAAEARVDGPQRAGATGDATVLADAIARAAAGMDMVARDATGARVLGARIDRVRFVAGAAPQLSLNGRTLVIGYDPAGGIAGRVSSSAVQHFLEENL